MFNEDTPHDAVWFMDLVAKVVRKLAQIAATLVLVWLLAVVLLNLDRVMPW